MTDKNEKPSPVTLEDYIPPAPKAEPRRREPSARDKKRLAEIERAVRETEPDAIHRRRAKARRARKTGYKASKPRQHRKPSKGRLVFWAIAIMFIVAFVLD